MSKNAVTLKEHIEKSKTNTGSIKVEGFLTIHLKKAIELIACDVTGKSDPYVYLAIGPSKTNVTKIYPKTAKSETKKQTLNPIYNETFSLPVADVASDYLLMEMWDWDRIGDDDFMGEIKVKLSDSGVTTKENVPMTLVLDKVASGLVEIDLSFSFTPVPEFNNAIEKYLKQYQFIISSVIANDLTRDIYREYLRKQKSEESALFVEKVLQFKSLFKASDKYYKASEIINAHIENLTAQQVVLPKEVRKEIIDKYKQGSESNCEASLFDKALEHQMSVLKGELRFDDFLKTGPFLRVLADNWRHLIPMIATHEHGEEISLIDVLKGIYGNRDEDALLMRMKKEAK